MNLWPHQEFGISRLQEEITAGTPSVCLTSPTGGGKSKIMIAVAEWALAELGNVVVYTPRKLLIDQLKRNFTDHGLSFGVRASDYPDDLRLEEPLQISSPATEDARCFKKVRWELHNAKVVMIDEIHMQKGDTIRRIIQAHRDRGSAIVLFTATPIGISDLAEKLIVAGNMSQLRACGALVPAEVYGCPEIDTSKIAVSKSGEFSYKGIKERWPASIYGHVLEHYKLLNPDREPSILFAPGVQESIWFAEKFREAGYRWAHIDGNDVWLDGEFYESNPDMRKHVLEMSKRGEILGICNRFVMREGVDMPWLQHCILATPIGSMVSYVQTVGRLLRAHPGIETVVLQDHGGNWWRHGSPNQDRDWEQYWTAPEHFATENRAERIRQRKEPEPIHCPQCDMIRSRGDTCPKCGFRHTTKKRIVIQHSGQLREMTGDIFRPRSRQMRANTQQIWDKYFWGSWKKGTRTFRQVEAWFFHEQHYWPPRTLNHMPTNDADWFRACRDVPLKHMIGGGEA